MCEIIGRKKELLRHGMEDIAQPKSWMEAFFLLERFLETCDNGSRQVVFIDELPWMDTARSGFLTALEAFWMIGAICAINCCSLSVVPPPPGCLTI